MEMKKPKVILKKRRKIVQPFMSTAELAKLGGGSVAYIREMSSEEAMELFPAVQLPPGVDIYTLHGADGTPLALTDTRQAAVGHAMGENLEVACVH